MSPISSHWKNLRSRNERPRGESRCWVCLCAMLCAVSMEETWHSSRSLRSLPPRLIRALALPPICWPDEGSGHRAAYGCRNPTSFSAGHRFKMKVLSPIRILRLPRRGSYRFTSPSDSSLLSASSTIFFSTLLRRDQKGLIERPQSTASQFGPSWNRASDYALAFIGRPLNLWRGMCF
jgi:hypothetical protein